MTNTLFPIDELVPWLAEWQSMPEFIVENLAPRFQIVVSFTCAGDVEQFGEAIGQKITANEKSRQTQSIWFPEQEIGRMVNKRYISREPEGRR